MNYKNTKRFLEEILEVAIKVKVILSDATLILFKKLLIIPRNKD